MQDIRKNMFDINTLTCYVCNYTATNKSNFKNHIYSMKHHKNVENLKNVEEEIIEEEDIIEDHTPCYTATFSEINTLVTPPHDTDNDDAIVQPSKPTRTRKRTTKKKQTKDTLNTDDKDKQSDIPSGYIQQEDLVDDVVGLPPFSLHEYGYNCDILTETSSTMGIVSTWGILLSAFYFIYTYIK